MFKKAQEVLQSSKKTLRSIKKDKILDGLSLESFAAVDLSVSAQERKAATQTISTELSQEQSNDKKISDKSVEKEDEIIID